MRSWFQVNALREILLWGWMGVSGVWGEEISLREGTGGEKVNQEIKVGGWKEDLGRMGFAVAMEELERGEMEGDVIKQTDRMRRLHARKVAAHEGRVAGRQIQTHLWVSQIQGELDIFLGPANH